MPWPFVYPAQKSPTPLLAEVQPVWANFLKLEALINSGLGNASVFLNGNLLWTTPGGGGSGTVTDVTGTLPIVITGVPTVTPNVTVDDFLPSGASHFRGTVPDPGAVAGTTHFLREDATWAVPPSAGNTGFFWALTLGGN